MAEASSRPKGRPRLTGSAHYVRLRSSVFELWNQRKDSLGFSGATHSVFAEFLLHRSPGPRPGHVEREEGIANDELDGNVFGGGIPQFVSTPIRPKRRHTSDVSTPAIQSSNSDVDITGTSCCGGHHTDKEENIGPSVLLCSQGMQSNFNSIAENPFSSLIEEDSDSVDVNEVELSDDEVESDDDDSLGSSDGQFHFGYRLDSILEGLCGSDDDEEENYSEDEPINSTLLGPIDMDVSDFDEEATLTMVEDNFESETQVEPPPNEAESVSRAAGRETASQAIRGEAASEATGEGLSTPAAGDPEDNSVAGNQQRIWNALEKAFSTLTSTHDLEDLVALHSRMRVMVSIEKLLELMGNKCCNEIDSHLCGADISHLTKHVGSRIDIEWKCTEGHYGKWESSEILTTNRYSKVFLNDSMMAIAIVLSGNNYAKFDLLCKVLNLEIISKTNFLSFQRNCSIPVVRDVWSKMQQVVLEILRGYKEICLCGDGRNDSPGHSARYCVYTLMEHATNVVVDLEVIDKRETGGNSTTMEKEGLRRLLERLMSSLPLSEICTDASATIIKLVRDMKEKFPLLLEMFHSLDVWHKAKKMTKALHQAARIKGCEQLKDWVEPIVNHFWYCCQMADGSVEELKETWQGVLHHVCGEHSWAESSCNHDPHVENESSRKPLAKSSKAMAALRKIVLDKNWLKNLHFYVRFRHTGNLESFNSMMTKYAPKRMAFEYPYFIMRIILAAIDHNMHLFRKSKLDKDGELVGHRKFSKRTQRFHAEVVKEEKEYAYFPYMVARMLQTRQEFQGSFSGRSDSDEFDPKQIAPTLGMKEPPPTEQLMKAPSRFLMKPKQSEDQ